VTLASLACFAAGYLAASRRRRRTTEGSPTATLVGIPDRSRRPSDGVVAEAAIVGHVLGLRLLTLDLTVVVSPAVVAAPASIRSAAPAARTPVGSADALPPAPIGRRLAEAVRRIDEGAAMLATARRADGGSAG